MSMSFFSVSLTVSFFPSYISHSHPKIMYEEEVVVKIDLSDTLNPNLNRTVPSKAPAITTLKDIHLTRKSYKTNSAYKDHDS